MNPESIPPIKRAEDKPNEEVDFEVEPLLPFPLKENPELEKYVHEHSYEMGFDGAKKWAQDVIQIAKEDEQAMKLIEETFQYIFSYIETIYNLEVTTKMLSLRWEGRELAEKVERHDGRRRRAHDALISSLIATTRYLNENFKGRVPETGIYNGDANHLVEKNRIAIADWAIEMEHEILLGRNK